MEYFKTRPIGEKFDYDGVTLEVARLKNGLCKGCYFTVDILTAKIEK